MMPSTVLLILLVLLFSLHLTTSTEFIAHGTLHCPERRIWCFRIRLMERDRFNPDDVIAELGIVCHPLHSNTYHLVKKVLSDEVTSKEFEGYLDLTHNCTADGSVFRMERLPVYGNLTAPVIEIPWSGRIYMKGVKISGYFN